MKYTKEEIYQHWYNFLKRSSEMGTDCLQLYNLIQNAFLDYYQSITIKHIDGTKKQAFTILEKGAKIYIYFTHEITDGVKKADPHHPEPGKIEFFIKFKFVTGYLGNYQGEKDIDVVDFLFEYCNPEFIDIIEKISWEIGG